MINSLLVIFCYHHRPDHSQLEGRTAQGCPHPFQNLCATTKPQTGKLELEINVTWQGWMGNVGRFPSSDAFGSLLHLCTSVVLSTLFIENRNCLK